MISQNWEEVHATRGWLTYPNPEMTKWVQHNYMLNGNEPRKPGEIKILDLGCGQGASTLFLCGCGFDTTAVDGSLSAIAKLNSNMEFHGFAITSAVCDIGSLPYPDEYFDAVIDIVAVCHNDNHKDIYNEVFRVLKPRGGLFSTVPASDTSPEIWQGFGPINFFSSEMIKDDLSEKFYYELSYKTIISFAHKQRLSHWIIEAQKKT